MPQTNSRGRGLGSLLSDTEMVVKKKIAKFNGVKELPLDQIQIGLHQPRFEFARDALEELTLSIQTHGVIQPITVRKVVVGEKFEIISGERRYRAAKQAQLETIPAFIRDVNDQRSLEMALIENIQRENLNPIEIALSYRRMIEECNLKQDELAQRVGKSRSLVTNHLRLLNLPTEIQSGLILSVITMGQAKPLIALNDEEVQLRLYSQILEKDLNAREIELLVKKSGKFEEQASELDIYKEDLRIEELELKNKTIVPLKLKALTLNKGEIALKFNSEEELNFILAMLGVKGQTEN